jgi:hypothetical protein
MAITRWTLDQCGCCCRYEYDNALPLDQRTHRVVEIVYACPRQTTAVVGMIWETHTCYQAHAKRSFVLDEIKESITRLVVKRLASNGAIEIDIAPGETLEATIDDEQIVRVRARLTPAEKAQVLANLRKSTHGLRRAAADAVVFE